MYWIIAAFLILLIIVIDLIFKVLLKKWMLPVMLLILPHIVLLCSVLPVYTGMPSAPLSAFVIAFASYFFIRLTFYTVPGRIRLSMRIRIMMGGRRIYLASTAALLMQIPLCIMLGIFHLNIRAGASVIAADIITVFAVLALFAVNGALRMLFTSRRLGIGKRLLFILLSWLPPVNMMLGLWICGIVKKEYIHEYINTELQNARADSQVCRTKYPLLMLHGVGFRDYKYINYWGRIPSLLIKNGASIYYGHQQAWGTIESNAEDIKRELVKILDQTGCGKVNIIAHSKGGLDARYLISSLGMAEHAASLTTISTPHRGSELVSTLGRIKEGAYKKLCGMVNAYFKKLGDTNPDAYNSGKQLLPEACEKFNIDNPDAPGVYYQSYAALMKSASSHSLLTVPFALMKWMSGDNDGLVTPESAKWGEFKGAFTSKKHRGVSHADLIDLMRQDYEGFNIAEEYVKIVAELKNRGY